MTITELIAKLEAVRTKYGGDIEVRVNNEWEYYEPYVEVTDLGQFDAGADDESYRDVCVVYPRISQNPRPPRPERLAALVAQMTPENQQGLAFDDPAFNAMARALEATVPPDATFEQFGKPPKPLL